MIKEKDINKREDTRMRNVYRNICILLLTAFVIAGIAITVGVGSTESANTENDEKGTGADTNPDDGITYGTNLIKNGGFETVSSSDATRPLYWGKYRTGTLGQFRYPQTGRASAKSIGVRYDTRDNDKITDWTQNINGIDDTKKYRLAGWMKTSSVSEYGGAHMSIDWKDSGGEYIGTSTVARKIGTSGWTFYEGIVKPMPGSASATILLGIEDSSGSAWFDDVSFRTAICY